MTLARDQASHVHYAQLMAMQAEAMLCMHTTVR